MLLLIMGLIVFIGIHSVSIVARPWREQVVGRYGVVVWQGGYSAFAAIGLVLIWMGYGAARMSPVLVYQPMSELRVVALIMMLPVFPLLLATYFRGRIQARLKHPMLTAVKLWATAHLMANGTLADLVLFGAILIWAIADRISVKRRQAAYPPGFPESKLNDALAVFIGIGIYVAFIGGVHQWLTGMPIS